MNVRAPAPTLLLLFAALTGCDNQQQSAKLETPPPAVGVAEVQQRAITTQDDFVGRVDATAKVELRARVQGFLKARNFEEGGEVNEGDVLFEIEPDRYQALVDEARAAITANKAQLTEAELRLKRYEKLRKAGTAAQQDLDEAIAAERSARAALEGSEAALAQAELDFSYTRITAPFTGRIGASAYDEGNLVGPDSGVLATLIDLAEVDVPFNVSEVDYLQFAKAQQQRLVNGLDRIQSHPTLVLADGTPYPHEGKFLFVDNQVNTGTGTLTIRARFPNPEGLLRPGMFVTLVVNRDREQEFILVPQSAVQSTQAGHSVLLVGADNKVQQRAVTLGERHNGDWIVLKGLEIGESVIVHGLQKAKPGAVVVPQRVGQVAPDA